MTDQPAPSATQAPTDPSSSPADPSSSPADPSSSPAAPSSSPPRSLIRRWGWVIVALAIVTAIVIVLAPLASPDPDGLESVAEQQGWLGTARDALFNIFPDYSIPGLDGAASTIVSGLIGVGIVFLVIVGLGWLLRRRSAARG